MQVLSQGGACYHGLDHLKSASADYTRILEEPGALPWAPTGGLLTGSRRGVSGSGFARDACHFVPELSAVRCGWNQRHVPPL